MHFLALATALAAAVSALPAHNAPHARHEKRGATPASWVKRSIVPDKALLPVRIGLSQSNLDRGHDMLMDISRHDSPNYGKHLTQEEVHDLFAPAEDTVAAIAQWLREAGIEKFKQSVNKQWMQLDLTAEELGSLLKTEYHEWEHVDSGDMHVACDEYHVPEHISKHIDYITPGVKLYAGPGAEKKRREMDLMKRGFGLPPLMSPLPSDVVVAAHAPAPSNINQCDRIVEPQCIRALYNITIGTTAAKNNELGIFEDLGDIYDKPDLKLFLSTLTNISANTQPVAKPIDGAPGPTTEENAGGESLLDLSIAMPLVYPQKVWLYQTDDAYYETHYNYAGFLNNFFDAIDGSYCTDKSFGGPSKLDPIYPDPNPGGYNGSLQCGKYRATNVISISYGGDEAGLPVNYQRRQCGEIMKLGLQGTTVVVSSGDSGVGDARGTNIANCLGNDGKIFVPDFPATCPYITTAGSTYLPRGASVAIDNERATDRFPSGGGFSNIYPRPDWQDAAVSNFLEYYNPYATYNISYKNQPSAADAGPGIFNRGGRGYPDIGAVGDNVLIYFKGAPYVLGGTSASAPAFASIITLINEQRITAGKGPVGFINPVLYANPSAFHDIANGSNPNCGSPGFLSVPGWDPVTGLGTPNFPALLKVFMALP